MGTQIADLYAKIGADTTGFDQGLGHVQKSMEDTQQKAGGLGSALSNMFSMAGGFLLAQGIGAVTGAVGGLVSGMVSGNAEFERYQTQFGVLLKSSEAAKDRLAELADFGAKTPFELPEVVRADKILQAFGLHAEDTAQRFGMSGKEIRTVAGDVAAGTGASFEEISTYLGKFASGATGEAIARMQELGIVTRDQLKQMGLEFSGSGQLISPLDESMTVLLASMKQKFGGMMDAQSSTFEGMLSNLKDWIGQTMRLVGAPIFDALKENLSGLLNLLNSEAVKGALQGLADGLGKAVAGGVATAKQLFQEFGPSVVKTFNDIRPTAEAFIQTVVSFWQTLGPPLAQVAGAILKLAGAIGESLAPVVAVLMDGTKQLAPVLAQVLGQALSWLAGFISETLVPVIQTLGVWIKDNLPGAIATLTAIWNGTLKPALETVWAFIQANVIPILLQLRDWLATNLPSAIATLTDFWNTKLKPALEAVWSFIKDPLLPLLKTLAEIVGVALMKAVEVLLAVWEKLQPAFKVVADFLAGTLNALLSGLVTTFENLRGPIGWVNDRLNEFKNALAGLSLPEWLQRHSPSPIEQTFAGLAAVTPQATATVDAFKTAVSGLDAASLNVAAVEQLAAAMRMLVDIMGAPGMGVERGSNDEERIQTMSDAIGRIASAIKNVVDTIRAVTEFGGSSDVAFLNGEARDWVMAVFGALTRLARDMAVEAGRVQVAFRSGVIEGLQAMASVLQTTVGIIKSVLDVVAVLSSEERERAERLLNDLAARSWIVALAQGLVYWGNLIADGVDNVVMTFRAGAIPGLEQLATVLSPVTDILGSVIDTVAVLADPDTRLVERLLNDLAARSWIVALAQGLVYWGNLIADAVDDIAIVFERDVATSLQTLGGILSGTTGVLSATIELVQAVIDLGKSGFPTVDAAGAVDMVIGPIVALAKALGARIQLAVGELTITRQPLSDLAGLLKDTLGLLHVPIDLLTALWSTDYDWMYNIKDPLAWAERNAQGVVAPINAIIALAKALAVKIQLAVGEMEPIETELAGLTGILSDMLDLIDKPIDLLTALWSTDYDWMYNIKDPLAWAERNAQGVVAPINAIIALAKALAVKIQQAVGEWEGTAPGIGDLSTILSDFGGLIGSVVDLIEPLANPPTLPAITPAILNWIDDLIGWARQVADAASVAAEGFRVGVNYGLDALGQALGDSVGVFGSIADAAEFIANPPTLPALTPQVVNWIDDVTGWARQVTEAATNAAEGFKIGVAYGLGELGTALGDSVGVFGSIADAAEFIANPPALPALTPRVINWIDDLVGWARTVGAVAADAADGFRLGADYGLDALGTAIGDTLGAIRDAIDLGGLLGNDLSLPSPQQVAAKMEAILRLVDEAVTTFGARAKAAAASGLDVAGLSQYAGAVKGVFEAIAEVANAVNSYSNINVGQQFLGVESVGFGNISGALRMIWALFEDAAQHQDLVQSVTSTLTTALDGLTMLATNKGADAGNAWLAGFTSAIGGGVAVPALAPAGTGTGGAAQITNNYVTNNTKSVSVSVNASTAEASRAGVTGIYSLVMY